MKLSDQQAHALLVLLQDTVSFSLDLGNRGEGGHLSIPKESRLKLLNDILAQQDTTVREPEGG